MAHNVKFKINRYAAMYPVFACTEAPGAPCRIGCELECEAWQDGIPCRHDLIDLGRCGFIEWLHESGEGLESYDGPPEDIEIVSGPVQLDWVSDGVKWRFLDREDS